MIFLLVYVQVTIRIYSNLGISVLSFSHTINSVILPVLSLLIQAGHVPESARHPRNVGFSGQPFLLHALLETFHVKTSRPASEIEKEEEEK